MIKRKGKGVGDRKDDNNIRKEEWKKKREKEEIRR